MSPGELASVILFVIAFFVGGAAVLLGIRPR